MQLLVLLLCLIGLGNSFDSGHHWDMTENVLYDLGFGTAAIKLVYLMNFITDYTSSDFLSSEKLQFKLTHFDNLLQKNMTREVMNKWTFNAKNGFQTIASEGDVIGLLTFIGMSLHGTQDFYTHTDWAEQFRPASAAECYNTYYQTLPIYANNPSLEGYEFFSGVVDTIIPESLEPLANRATDPGHGGYTCGLNKDSYVRPKWTYSYTYAYFATREWVDNVQIWINNSALWDSMKTWTPADSDESDQLDAGIQYALGISMYVQDGAIGAARHDGHWKGSGSGNKVAFGISTAGMTLSSFYRNSRFLEQVRTKQRQLLLVDDLYESSGTPDQTLTTSSYAVTQVFVRTVKVTSTSSFLGSDNIDRLSDPDLYTIITIGDDPYEIQSSIQFDKEEFFPEWTAVRSFHGAGPATVAIKYKLFDASITGSTVSAEQINVNPNGGKKELDLVYTITTGELSGDVSPPTIANTEATSITFEGDDGKRAKVQLYVYHRTVQTCPPTSQQIEAGGNWTKSDFPSYDDCLNSGAGYTVPSVFLSLLFCAIFLAL